MCEDPNHIFYISDHFSIYRGSLYSNKWSKDFNLNIIKQLYHCLLGVKKKIKLKQFCQRLRSTMAAYWHFELNKTKMWEKGMSDQRTKS
jgi:hypothetical protein